MIASFSQNVFRYSTVGRSFITTLSQSCVFLSGSSNTTPNEAVTSKGSTSTKQSDLKKFVVHIKDLPINTTIHQLILALYTVGPGIQQVNIVKTHRGNPVGQAYVKFTDEKFYREALECDRKLKLSSKARILPLKAEDHISLIVDDHIQPKTTNEISLSGQNFRNNSQEVARSGSAATTSVLILKNLPLNSTEDSIKAVLEDCARDVTSIHLNPARSDQEIHGAAHVAFTSQNAGAKALELLSKTTIRASPSSDVDMRRAMMQSINLKTGKFIICVEFSPPTTAITEDSVFYFLKDSAGSITRIYTAANMPSSDLRRSVAFVQLSDESDYHKALRLHGKSGATVQPATLATLKAALWTGKGKVRAVIDQEAGVAKHIKDSNGSGNGPITLTADDPSISVPKVKNQKLPASNQKLKKSSQALAFTKPDSLSTSVIMLKKLPLNSTEDSIKTILQEYAADVKSIHLNLTRSDQTFRGVAHVSFNSQNTAAKALELLSKTAIQETSAQFVLVSHSTNAHMRAAITRSKGLPDTCVRVQVPANGKFTVADIKQVFAPLEVSTVALLHYYHHEDFRSVNVNFTNAADAAKANELSKRLRWVWTSVDQQKDPQNGAFQPPAIDAMAGKYVIRVQFSKDNVLSEEQVRSLLKDCATSIEKIYIAANTPTGGLLPFLGFVLLSNESDYQKGLTLHEHEMDGQRVIVQPATHAILEAALWRGKGGKARAVIDHKESVNPGEGKSV